MTENDKRPASGDRRPRKPGAGRPSGPGRPKSGAPRSGAPRSGAPKSGAPRSSTPRDGEGRNTPRTGGQRRGEATREGGRPRRDDAPRGSRPFSAERGGRPGAPRKPFGDRREARPPRDDDRAGQSDSRVSVLVKKKRELSSGLPPSYPVLLVLPLNIHVLVLEY